MKETTKVGDKEREIILVFVFKDINRSEPKRRTTFQNKSVNLFVLFF